MLKFENGRIQAKGTGAQLCMELSFLAKTIRDNIAKNTDMEFAEAEMEKAFENSKLSYEDIVSKYIEGKKDADCALKDLLFKTLFGGRI